MRFSEGPDLGINNSLSAALMVTMGQSKNRDRADQATTNQGARTPASDVRAPTKTLKTLLKRRHVHHDRRRALGLAYRGRRELGIHEQRC